MMTNSFFFSIRFIKMTMKLHRLCLEPLITLFFFFFFFLLLQFGLSSTTEYVALLQLRSSLGISNKDWPKKTEPCWNWTGVRCHDGRVVALNLTGLSRTGTGLLQPRFAVDSVSNLTLLASFTASGFVLNGSIPECFGHRLTNLHSLDLRSCSLTGPVPSSLGGLIGLNSLLLSGNNLAGRMPSELGMLSGLKFLDLSGNSLTGTVPNALSSLVNLTSLDLSRNFLSGSVPTYLGALSSLRSLNLSDNALTGSVPLQLGNHSSLVSLDLGKNSLSGSLPGFLFSKLYKLEVLILSENAFDGALPDSLWLGPNFQFLDLSSNNLTGPLPKFSGLSNVNYSGSATFNLSNNLLYGNLSTLVSSKLGTIDLSGNYFQGEVQVGGFNNATLAGNCLWMIPNQRDFNDCRAFYVKRSSALSTGAQEPMVWPSQDSESRNNKGVIFILAGIFGVLVFIVLLVLVLIMLLKRGDSYSSISIRGGTENVGSVPEVENHPTPPKDHPVFLAGIGESFTYGQMLHFTGNFAEENLIKHGHSGDLFLGTLGGRATAVFKKVDLDLFKKEPYMAELELLTKISHSRLVPLLGHCLENEHDKFIVYKYMPNGDLETSLHRVTSSNDKLQSLDWITRLKIAIGAAEGLSYLHECNPPFVHRDVQASSILLDDRFEVRLGSLSEVTVQGDQSVITRIFRKSASFDQGNSGLSLATCPHDVYCFGKVLLELVSGNVGVSKSDDAATKEWLERTLSCISVYDKQQVTKIIDPYLIVDDDLLEEVWAMAIVAKSCLNPKPSKRPPMRYVLKALENPVSVVREENYSSTRLRTTSSRRSWSFALFGSWTLSSSESATTTGHANREGIINSGFKQSGRVVGSQGSGGIDLSHKRSSNEIFPEPLEIARHEVAR